MTPESHTSINADDIIDVAIHHEIKYRAYELYERKHDTLDGHDLKGQAPGRVAPCGLCSGPASEVLQWRDRGHQSRQSGSGVPARSRLFYL